MGNLVLVSALALAEFVSFGFVTLREALRQKEYNENGYVAVDRCFFRLRQAFFMLFAVFQKKSSYLSLRRLELWIVYSYLLLKLLPGIGGESFLD
jgi:hypothetical protein